MGPGAHKIYSSLGINGKERIAGAWSSRIAPRLFLCILPAPLGRAPGKSGCADPRELDSNRMGGRLGSSGEKVPVRNTPRERANGGYNPAGRSAGDSLGVGHPSCRLGTADRAARSYFLHGAEAVGRRGEHLHCRGLQRGMLARFLEPPLWVLFPCRKLCSLVYVPIDRASGRCGLHNRVERSPHRVDRVVTAGVFKSFLAHEVAAPSHFGLRALTLSR